MQVRVCPKCGVENKPTNASCSSCYTSLASVPKTESNVSSQPVALGQPTQAATHPAPLMAPQMPGVGQQPRGPVPGQPAPGPYSPSAGPGGYSPDFREGMKPIQKKSSAGPIIAVILILALLGVGGFFAYKYTMKPLTPKQVVEKMVTAIQKGDYQAFKSCISSASIEQVKKQYGTEEKAAEDLKADAAKNSGTDPFSKVTLQEGVVENDTTAFVPFDLKEKPAMMGGMAADFKLGLVLVKEDNAWKVDLDKTEVRLVDEMDKAFKKAGVPFDFKAAYQAEKARQKSQGGNAGSSPFSMFGSK